MPDPESAAERPAEATQTPAEALTDARDHALRGLGEMILAARSLLDAASLAMNRQAASDTAVFAPLAQMLDEWAQRLGHHGDMGQLIFDALEVEIRRWEARSAEDEEARSVLRAFLGLREFLWELGIRPSEHQSGPASALRPNDGGDSPNDPTQGPRRPRAETSC